MSKEFAAAGLTVGQLNALVKKIGGYEAVMSILRGSVEVGTKAGDYISAAFNKDRIDYDRSIGDFLRAGRYNWINDSISCSSFKPKESGHGEVEYVIFHFNQETSSEANILEINKAGCAPSTVKEFLNFGEKHPEIQRQFPIVALGSVVERGRDNLVGYLGSEGRHRYLFLQQFNNVWSNSYHFLGVHRV